MLYPPGVYAPAPPCPPAQGASTEPSHAEKEASKESSQKGSDAGDDGDTEDADGEPDGNDSADSVEGRSSSTEENSSQDAQPYDSPAQAQGATGGIEADAVLGSVTELHESVSRAQSVQPSHTLLSEEDEEETLMLNPGTLMTLLFVLES